MKAFWAIGCISVIDLFDEIKRILSKLWSCPSYYMDTPRRRCLRKSLTAMHKMLWSLLNKSFKQPPTKQQLYGHLPPISKTIKVQRKTCWTLIESKDKPMSDFFHWTPTHGRVSVGTQVRIYLPQPCTGTGCRLEDLLEAMDEWNMYRERIWEISASDTASWWWHLSRIIWCLDAM